MKFKYIANDYARLKLELESLRMTKDGWYMNPYYDATSGCMYFKFSTYSGNISFTLKENEIVSLKDMLEDILK